MKTLATAAVCILLAGSAAAAVVHDESVNGDLSSNAGAPTAVAFASGSNTVIGSVSNVGGADTRDYLTFTVPAGLKLVGLNLIAYAPANLGFASFNTGATSFIPSAGTDPLFLAGIHVSGAHVGLDLMPEFVNNAVTTNSLLAPELDPGQYCFLIQQTSPTTSTYQLEFVIDGNVPALPSTWGTIKRLYR
jgi:hypothetical protein